MSGIFHNLRKNNFLKANGPVNHDSLADKDHQLTIRTGCQVIHIGLLVQHPLYFCEGTSLIENDIANGGDCYEVAGVGSGYKGEVVLIDVVGSVYISGLQLFEGVRVVVVQSINPLGAGR